MDDNNALISKSKLASTSRAKLCATRQTGLREGTHRIAQQEVVHMAELAARKAAVHKAAVRMSAVRIAAAVHTVPEQAAFHRHHHLAYPAWLRLLVESLPSIGRREQ